MVVKPTFLRVTQRALMRTALVRLAAGGLLAAFCFGCSAMAHPLAVESAQKAPKAGREAASSQAQRQGSKRIYHRVARGQTLYRIALMYGVTVDELRRANALTDPGRLVEGRVLVIPQGRSGADGREAAAIAAAARPRKARPGKPSPSATSRGASRPWSASASPSAIPALPSAAPPSARASAGSPYSPVARVPEAALDSEDVPRGDAPLPLDAAGVSDSDEDLVGPDEAPVGISYTLLPTEEPFLWPVAEGVVRSTFGPRHGRLHAGIDISAPVGSFVSSARDGTVLYSGHKFRGYGNVVMIDHGDGFVTIYAHNSRNLVGRGQRVRQGEPIALVGATGNATGSHCHFEIRRANVALDPQPYLTLARAEPSLISRRAGSHSGSRRLEAGMITSPGPLP